MKTIRTKLGKAYFVQCDQHGIIAKDVTERIYCACLAVFEMQRKLVSIVDRPETLFCFTQSTFVLTRQLGLLNSLIAYV